MNETLTRTLSGIVYIAILVTATLFLPSFLLLFGIFLLITVAEFCELVHIKRFLPIGIAIAAYLLLTFTPLNRNMQWLLLAATLFVSFKCMVFLFAKNQRPLDVLSKYVYLIGYIILPIVLITKIPLITTDYTPKIIISIFILIWANDTFAFVIGKSFGKHKLFERISPKKTIEGFLGGLIFALIFSVLIAQYFVLEPTVLWIGISLVVSIFGTIGDLIESKFKRLAGVKDSGKIMPGHGGILDRLDSIIFVAPFVFLLYQILYYVS
ncbi:phosphatidate cytidylyltransferase [Flavobacterium sp.]|uniref:phosphatidate cytidylyltransferase n=1 Tax=Flavobacterium sp. TaxID=239 RepID=UPI0039E3D25C